MGKDLHNLSSTLYKNIIFNGLFASNANNPFETENTLIANIIECFFPLLYLKTIPPNSDLITAAVIDMTVKVAMSEHYLITLPTREFLSASFVFVH